MGVSYKRIALPAVSEDTRKKCMNFRHSHIVYVDREGKIYLVGSYANDIFSYFIELEVDHWDIRMDEESAVKLAEIQKIMEDEYNNKAMYRYNGSRINLDDWVLREHICKLGELNPNHLDLIDIKFMLDKAEKQMRFYAKFINWDRVNMVLDEVDCEKPKSSGWGIHYPNKLYDELEELYDKDFILLSDDKYARETYIRLQEHMLEEMIYYYQSMR